MAYNYVVTAQKPTHVTHSLVAAFTGPEDTNLIVAKSTRLEIYKVTPEEVILVHDVPIYGKLAIVEKLRGDREPQDWLFLLTASDQYCVLYYDAQLREVVTKAKGTVHEIIGQPADVKLCTVDPQYRMIALRIHDHGALKIIPIQPTGQLRETYTVKMDELKVWDIKFLHGCSKPTIAVLCEDHRHYRHVKTFVVQSKDRDLTPGPWLQSNVDGGATKLVPVPEPFGGVLVLGQQSVTYHSGSGFKSVKVSNTQFEAYGLVDDNGSRFLLGDHAGGLHVLLLQPDAQGRAVESLAIENVGETSLASTITYLDEGVVFVGSFGGDSQLIKLNPERDENGSYVTSLVVYPNLGPIVDMCLVDLDRQGQAQAVTCSGIAKDGSLKVIRNGIGINEQATIEMEGITGMWSLRQATQDPYDKYLIQGFITETRVLAIEKDEEGGAEMGELEASGFLPNRTLYCGNVLGDMFVQATEEGVALMSCETLQPINVWRPPDGVSISVAAANETRVAVACGGGTLVLLEVAERERVLKQTATKQMEHEIACISLNPPANKPAGVRQDDPMSVDDGVEETKASQPHKSSASVLDTVIAVGMWFDMTVRLLTLPDLTEVHKQSLGGDTQARSVTLVTFDRQHFLLVGLGDGHLVSFPVDLSGGITAPKLGNKKKLSLGTQPIALTVFRGNGETCVFVASDRPTVVYSKNGKMLFANVNRGEVTSVCSFHSEPYPDCLAFANEGELMIGTIDEIRKLHIKDVKLGEQPRRIAHHEQGRLFAVVTTAWKLHQDSQEEEDTGHIRFLDDTTFDEVYCHYLDPFEQGMSLIQATFAGSDRQYIVAGTGYVREGEFEPPNGRLLVFAVEGEGANRKVLPPVEKEVKGGVYTLNSFNGKLLTGINSRLELYRWAERDDSLQELQMECSCKGHVIVLFVQSRGDFILVGDLMRSMSLMQYRSIDSTIDEVARDYNANWMAAIAMLNDDYFIGNEQDCNLLTLRRNAAAATDEEAATLEFQGGFHLGEFVNKFEAGSLVMQPSDVDSASILTARPLLFGAVSGMLGVVLSINEEWYEFFLHLQQAMLQVVKGVGGFSHHEWRQFRTARRTIDSSNFIDGDLVESFLDMPRDRQAKVVELLEEDFQAKAILASAQEAAEHLPQKSLLTAGLTLESVSLRVEEIQRLH